MIYPCTIPALFRFFVPNVLTLHLAFDLLVYEKGRFLTMGELGFSFLEPRAVMATLIQALSGFGGGRYGPAGCRLR